MATEKTIDPADMVFVAAMPIIPAVYVITAISGLKVTIRESVIPIVAAIPFPPLNLR